MQLCSFSGHRLTSQGLIALEWEGWRHRAPHSETLAVHTPVQIYPQNYYLPASAPKYGPSQLTGQRWAEHTVSADLRTKLQKKAALWWGYVWLTANLQPPLHPEFQQKQLSLPRLRWQFLTFHTPIETFSGKQETMWHCRHNRKKVNYSLCSIWKNAPWLCHKEKSDCFTTTWLLLSLKKVWNPMKMKHREAIMCSWTSSRGRGHVKRVKLTVSPVPNLFG